MTSNKNLILSIALCLFALSGCGQDPSSSDRPGVINGLCKVFNCEGYWWTRGQPPSVETMIERASGKLAIARESNGEERKKVATLSSKVENSLNSAVSKVQSTAVSTADLMIDLTVARDAFIELEGKLSVGSRAAFGELSGQLRRFTALAEDGQQVPYPAFAMFTARTLSFLASEISVPAPSFG